jgi:hypothetical protein
MRAPLRVLRAAAPVLLAACFAILLCACASLATIDELPPGVEKGWVVFLSDDRLPLSISRLDRGIAGEPYGNRTARGTPVAVACPPGRNDFLVRVESGENRVAVPVAEGMVTYVGVGMQVISEKPTLTHHLRISVGRHPVPFKPDTNDPAPLVTALADSDWATRWAAIQALARISPPLEPSATPLLQALAREDAYEEVRAAAQAALRSAGKPSPADPLVFIAFERSADGWPLGEGLASTASLLAEGYLLAVQDPHATAWRVRSAGSAIADRGDLDVLLECRWLGGDETGAYGLTLGSSPGTFNAFCISRSGSATALRFTDGRNLSAPLPWVYGAAAAITGTPVARIAVSKRGTRYELAVNGEAVGGFTDGSGLTVSHLGVFVDGAQSVVFRKIVVTAP